MSLRRSSALVMPFARAISSNASPRGRGTSVLTWTTGDRLLVTICAGLFSHEASPPESDSDGFPPISIHRAVLRQTQGSSAQGRRALNPRPLGSNRNNPRHRYPRRVQQLLQTRRVWVKLLGIRSSFLRRMRSREGTRGHDQTRPCPASSIIEEASENP